MKTKEEKNAYAREYYRKNKDKIRAKQREARKKNPEKFREYQRRYVAKNLEKVRARSRKWNEENPDKRKNQCGKYRAKKKEAKRALKASMWLNKKFVEDQLSRGRDVGDIAIVTGVKVSRIQAVLKNGSYFVGNGN